MKKAKRSLSALLAVVMVFTTMAAAFSVTGSAVSAVPRIAATRLSPTIEFSVPQVIETWGTDYYQAGSNVRAIGEIQSTITTHITDASVENISLQCSDAGIQISPRQVQGEGGSYWAIQGGVLKTAPADDGTTVVKWTLTCTIAGKSYEAYAWSQVQPHYNNPGFAVKVRHKYRWSSHTTYNHHVEWIQPVFGNPATETADNYSQCYINEGLGQHYAATGVYASAYYWDWNQGSGDDEKHTSALTAKGTTYVDYSQKTTLQDVGLSSRAKTHQSLEDPDNHPQYYEGTTISEQSVNGRTSSAFSVDSPGEKELGVGQETGATFLGELPAPGTTGGTAKIDATIIWEGQITRSLGITAKSYHQTTCKYQINIVTYDKTALLAKLNAVTAQGYQPAQFRNTAPEGVSSAFRTWDEYFTALQNAWYIYGRTDVTQSDINDAIQTLDAALPKYNASTNAWEGGMMYADADYSQINTIKGTIADTLEPDFYEDYSDGTHGKYYQYSLASALNDVLEDIASDEPLDARYQGVVDQMRVNLTNAINALQETSTKKTTKLVSLEFEPNMTGVSNMPGTITTSLSGQFTLPTTEPTKQYYRFTGWYYDAATTQRVTGTTVYINPESPYFKADLETKVDNAGVAYTLYAGWAVTGKMLTFDTQGGSAIAPYVGASGEQYTGPTETPTKTGCRFIGWYTDDTFETPVDWETFTLGSVDVVYAKWAENSFTVTFNATGGKFMDGSASYSVTDLYSAPVAMPIPPTLTNNGFIGWYYDSALTNPVDMDNFTIPDDNIQVYAKWSTGVRTLVFDPQNGDPLIIQTYDVGTRVLASYAPTPERAGFTLDGWYRNAEGEGSPRTFPFSLTASTTLFAKWTGEPYTIEFDPAGGEMADDFNPNDYVDLECGSEIPAPEDPTKPEWVFDGWLLDGEPFDMIVPYREGESTITLVASWKEEPYVATFRLRTDVEGDTVEQGDIITATVSMMANRYVANHRFVVYYDSRYLWPALNGKQVTSNISGTAACSKIANRAYFTLVRNAGGHNVTDCGTPTGRITPNTIAPVLTFFPEEWAVSNTQLKDEYKYYRFVYFDAPDVASGTRSRPTTEQDLASFQFIVLDDAPIADGVSTYAHLLLSEDFVRTAENTTGNRTAACLQADAAYNNVKDWDNTTNVVVDGDHRFAVTQMHACTINFITNGGEAVDSIDAKQGSTITLPTPNRDYYTLAGWTLTNDASDTDYVNKTAFEVPYQDSITLYAKWTGKQVNYYVRHHKQNLDASGFIETYEQQTIKGQVGTTVTATAKTYDGFTCSNPGISGEVRGETSNPLILDLWYLRNTTKITLLANGGKFANGQDTMVLSGLFDNTVTNAPADPTREGYTFGYWEQDTVAYGISKYPANDITLTAKWNAKDITVRFFLDGATEPTWTREGKYGDALEMPEVDPGAGKVFSGWKTAAGELVNYTTFPADSVDLYGTVGIDGYILTLYIGGAQYGDPIEVLNGTQVTEASIGYSAPPGYRFSGWKTENSVDGQAAVFPMTLTADTSLYGFNVRETYTITTYIVYIDGDPEIDKTIGNLFYGQAFDLPVPDDYTDDGYGFRGWYTDPEMTTLYEKPATMPAQNIVLYGIYYEMTGTVEFDLNGGTGTAPASITKPLGATVSNLPDGTGFTRKYYSFGGWSTSKTSSTAVQSVTFNSEEPITLYAIWKVNYATVTFNLNGAESGTKPENMQVEVGETIPAANLPSGEDFVRDGYTFSGWSDKQNATAGLESYAPASTGVKTLYAVWIADTVTLIAREGSTTVIDDERGFIYGLDFNLTVNDLTENYLDVIGNGHLEYSTLAAGTGTLVYVVNDSSGNIDATYELVIFGDLDGDGMMGSNDVTQMRAISAQVVVHPEGSAKRLASDVNHDGLVNSSDHTLIRSRAAHLSEISQTI